MSQLAPADLRLIGGLVHARAGLLLTEDKAYLVESRLGPVARQLGFGSLQALTTALRRGPPPASVLDAVTEALTTNETSFFRDGYPFSLLRQAMLPELLRRRAATRRLRIWSAAAATGQEAWSIAFCLAEEAGPLRGWETDILGTDLATTAIARAQAGRYTHLEVQRGLPAQLLVRHFERAGRDWQVRPESCPRVRFACHNLLADARPLGRFDIVFLRNILIYMDPATRRRVLERVGEVLAADGFLLLGGTETVLGITDRLIPEPGLSGLYRPAARPAGSAARLGAA